ASGKTALGIALAQRFGGEIVSADSRQIYRQMDIGTAKPTPEERAAAPHHLLDRKSTRLNSSHVKISYAVFCLKKKIKTTHPKRPCEARCRSVRRQARLERLVGHARGGVARYRACYPGWRGRASVMYAARVSRS